MITFVEVLQRGHNLESASASEHIATARCDHDRESIRNGVGMDDKREYQAVCNSTSGCESV